MKPRILVVDDNPDVRAILKLRLGKAGFDVLTADDGGIGLVMVRDARPVFVLLDLDTPKVNGFKFLSALPRYQYGPLPVFVMAENDDPVIVRRVHALGANRLITKGQALHPGFADALRNEIQRIDAERAMLAARDTARTTVHPAPFTAVGGLLPA